MIAAQDQTILCIPSSLLRWELSISGTVERTQTDDLQPDKQIDVKPPRTELQIFLWNRSRRILSVSLDPTGGERHERRARVTEKKKNYCSEISPSLKFWLSALLAPRLENRRSNCVCQEHYVTWSPSGPRSKIWAGSDRGSGVRRGKTI